MSTAKLTVVPEAPPILGRLEAVHGDRVLGWAWDRKAPEARLEVELRLGDQPLKTFVADLHRADLQTAGIGDGGHAFDVRVGSPLPAERKGEIKAFVRPAGGGEPVALPHPNATEKAVETLVAPHLSQIVRTLEAALALLRQAASARKAAQQSLGDLITHSHEAQAGAIERLEQALTDQQSALKEQVTSLEVFLLRIDEALRALTERVAEPPRPVRGRFLISAVALTALVLVSATAAAVLTRLIG